jgi:hypothetical protein
MGLDWLCDHMARAMAMSTMPTRVAEGMENTLKLFGKHIIPGGHRGIF